MAGASSYQTGNTDGWCVCVCVCVHVVCVCVLTSLGVMVMVAMVILKKVSSVYLLLPLSKY